LRNFSSVEPNGTQINWESTSVQWSTGRKVYTAVNAHIHI